MPPVSCVGYVLFVFGLVVWCLLCFGCVLRVDDKRASFNSFFQLSSTSLFLTLTFIYYSFDINLHSLECN